MAQSDVPEQFGKAVAHCGVPLCRVESSVWVIIMEGICTVCYSMECSGAL